VGYLLFSLPFLPAFSSYLIFLPSFSRHRDDFTAPHAGNDAKPHDASAPADDVVAPNNIFGGPVSPLGEHVRFERADQRQRRRLAKDDDPVYAAEGGDDFCALQGRDDGPPRTLQTPHTRIAVHCDDQAVSAITRLLETPDVADVKQIEAAVRENNNLPAPPGARDLT